MKRYEDVSIVGENESQKFLDKLGKEIGKFQNKGYEVEVQYSVNNQTFTALVLSYRKV
jgi:hypothetical protein